MKMGSSSIKEEEGRIWRKRSHEKYEHYKSVSSSHKKHHSPHHVNITPYISESSSNNPKMSLVRHLKIRHEKYNLQGEIKKIKPPTFYCEDRKGEDVEAWLWGMRKYLKMHNYSSNMESRISIYKLQGKAPIYIWEF